MLILFITWPRASKPFLEALLALLNSATKKVYKSDPSPAEFIPVNEGIVLGGLANPTQGDGTLYINITYRKLKLDTTF